MRSYLDAEGRKRQTGGGGGSENDFAFNHLLIAGAVFFVFKKW
jgi:hypothetical protein